MPLQRVYNAGKNKIILLSVGRWEVEAGYGGLISARDPDKDVLVLLLEPGTVFEVLPGLQVCRYAKCLEIVDTDKIPTMDPLIDRIEFLSLPVKERLARAAGCIDRLIEAGVYQMYIAQFVGCGRRHIMRSPAAAGFMIRPDPPGRDSFKRSPPQLSSNSGLRRGLI